MKLDETEIWQVLLALRRCLRSEHGRAASYIVQPTSELAVQVQRDSAGGWLLDAKLSTAATKLFDLYQPLLRSLDAPPFVIGHLGQSLDGMIATASGSSYQLNGPENIVHLHRLRALSDGILVGADTVRNDDPQLTTRLVEGDNPVRIVLDPRRRLRSDFRLFQDGAAKTILCCDREYLDSADPDTVIGLPVDDAGNLNLQQLLATLHRTGIQVLFVEGGGRTVSAFLQAGLLNRLHIAVAPLIVGQGRRGLQLPGAADLSRALRPPARHYAMGRDILFDCRLRE